MLRRKGGLDAFALLPALKAAQNLRVFRKVEYDQERQQRTCSGSTPVESLTLPGAEGLTSCAGAGVEWARWRKSDCHAVGVVKLLGFLQAEFCKRAAARLQRPAASFSPPPMRDFSFHPGEATNLRHPTTFRGNSACGRLIRLFQGARPARSSYGWSEDWRPEWGNLMLRLGLLSA